MSPRRGSARIERLPRARGPHSERPWYQPTTSPAAMAVGGLGVSQALLRRAIVSIAISPQAPSRPLGLRDAGGEGAADRLLAVGAVPR